MGVARPGLDRRLFGRDANDQVRQFAVQCFADQVQMFQINPLGKLMIQFVDRRGPDSGLSGKIRLRPPPFAEAGGK